MELQLNITKARRPYTSSARFNRRNNQFKTVVPDSFADIQKIGSTRLMSSTRLDHQQDSRFHKQLLSVKIEKRNPFNRHTNYHLRTYCNLVKPKLLSSQTSLSPEEQACETSKSQKRIKKSKRKTQKLQDKKMTLQDLYKFCKQQNQKYQNEVLKSMLNQYHNLVKSRSFKDLSLSQKSRLFFIIKELQFQLVEDDVDQLDCQPEEPTPVAVKDMLEIKRPIVINKIISNLIYNTDLEYLKEELQKSGSRRSLSQVSNIIKNFNYFGAMSERQLNQVIRTCRLSYLQVGQKFIGRQNQINLLIRGSLILFDQLQKIHTFYEGEVIEFNQFKENKEDQLTSLKEIRDYFDHGPKQFQSKMRIQAEQQSYLLIFSDLRKNDKLENIYSGELMEKIHFFKTFQSFAEIQDKYLVMFSEYVKARRMSESAELIKEGEIPSKIIFLKEGRCRIIKYIKTQKKIQNQRKDRFVFSSLNSFSRTDKNKKTFYKYNKSKEQYKVGQITTGQSISTRALLPQSAHKPFKAFLFIDKNQTVIYQMIASCLMNCPKSVQECLLKLAGHERQFDSHVTLRYEQQLKEWQKNKNKEILLSM